MSASSADLPVSLAAALADLQQHLPRIGKDKTATVPTKDGRKYTYDYANLTTVSEALLPLLGKRGLSFVAYPDMERDDSRFFLRFTLQHVSGETIDGSYPLPTSGSPQQIGSAITYARRYCLLAVTGAAPDEDDDDAQEAEAAARAQRNHAPETRADGSATEAELERMRSGSEPGTWRSSGTAENDPFYDQPEYAPGPPVQEEDKPGSIAKRQLSIMHAKFAALGITEREKRLRWTEVVIGRPVESANDLSYREAGMLLEALTEEARERSRSSV